MSDISEQRRRELIAEAMDKFDTLGRSREDACRAAFLHGVLCGAGVLLCVAAIILNLVAGR